MDSTPDQQSRTAEAVHSFACEHHDTGEKAIGEPPYSVQIPSQAGRLCPTCFLHDIHEERFLEHEHRLNLGELDGEPYEVWFSMLLRQRQILRYESAIQSRSDLSNAGKERVLITFLDAVRSISRRYPCKAWQAFNPALAPVYQEVGDALLQALLHVQLSGAPIPTCDCVVTLKVVDLTPIELGQAEPVPLPTLDAWNTASCGRSLVLVCHKTMLCSLPAGGYVRRLQDERVGYLVEDPATLQFLWQATRREFRKQVSVEGRLQMVTEQWPIYALESPQVLLERSFLVKPSFFSPFGLSWHYHPEQMPSLPPVQWIDDLWDYGGTIPAHLQFATDIRLDGTQGAFPPMHHVEERPLCLYCAEPIDLSLVSTLGAGAPDCCAGGCGAALRGVPFPWLSAQRVRRRQMKSLSPLGPTPALCNCLHHQAAQCTQKRFKNAHGFLPCSCACHIAVSGQPISEEEWRAKRSEWEERRREWNAALMHALCPDNL